MEHPLMVVCPMCRGTLQMIDAQTGSPEASCRYCEGPSPGEVEYERAKLLMEDGGVENKELQDLLEEYYRAKGDTVFDVAHRLDINKNRIYQFATRTDKYLLKSFERVRLWNFLARWQGRPLKLGSVKEKTQANFSGDSCQVPSYWFGG